MKLYFSPGACSLSPHIALREAGLPFTLERVDLRAKRTEDSDEDFTAINPKGYVPALVLDDGDLLTEGAVIVQYVADCKPELGLAPPAGTRARLRLQEWLHFIATELHKATGPLYHPKAAPEHRQAVREKLAKRYSFLSQALAGRPYLMGAEFTVADGYAFYALRSWKSLAKADLRDWPVLGAYFDRIAARPAVQAALEAEGLSG